MSDDLYVGFKLIFRFHPAAKALVLTSSAISWLLAYLPIGLVQKVFLMLLNFNLLMILVGFEYSRLLNEAELKEKAYRRALFGNIKE